MEGGFRVDLVAGWVAVMVVAWVDLGRKLEVVLLGVGCSETDEKDEEEEC